MKVLVQRSKQSNVTVNGSIVGEIPYGVVLFVGFTHTDTKKEIEFLADKVLNLRIFDDENGVMNKSLLDIGGSILSISQFTLYADTEKGRRPSYQKAMKSETAINLYHQFNQILKEKVVVETGIFGADMQVSITNDGPVTILLQKENCYD